MRRDRDAHRRLILPIRKPPFSRLHTPGSIPFWMPADAQIETINPSIDPFRAVCILQDTGHELWLFLSRRGLEIRSFYRVPPRALTDPVIQGGHIHLEAPCGRRKHPQYFVKPFQGCHETLECRTIGWKDLMPEAGLSGHRRIARTTLIASLPDWQSGEAAARITPPAMLTQVIIGEIDVKIGPVRIAVSKMSDHSTRISSQTGDDCRLCGSCHLSVTPLSGEAQRINDMVSALTLRQRVRLWAERCGSQRAAPILFPQQTA